MPKYSVYGYIRTSKFIGEFEAATKEEAEQMAWDSDEAYVSVCHHCARQVQDPEIISMDVEEIPD
ncbi:hypothetical protein ACFSR7_35875 [Cohnella sp. GCM10020058]|uniref:hypothetical protein n=1 Tax=Cohnella sp. GCM10020058 TaxID=3317330 RepID=UPI0036448C35